MLTPAQEREVAIYRLTDLIAEQMGWDGPFRVHHEGELLAMAEASVDEEVCGEVKPYHFRVMAYRDGTGWVYDAVTPDVKVPGCDHWVDAPSRALGRAAAVTEHRQECLKWRV
jgi:hypothetical protein